MLGKRKASVEELSLAPPRSSRRLMGVPAQVFPMAAPLSFLLSMFTLSEKWRPLPLDCQWVDPKAVSGKIVTGSLNLSVLALITCIKYNIPMNKIMNAWYTFVRSIAQRVYRTNYKTAYSVMEVWEKVQEQAACSGKYYEENASNFLYEVAFAGHCNCACGTRMLKEIMHVIDPELVTVEVYVPGHAMLEVRNVPKGTHSSEGGFSIGSPDPDEYKEQDFVIETTAVPPYLMSVTDYKTKKEPIFFEETDNNLTNLIEWLEEIETAYYDSESKGEKLVQSLTTKLPTSYDNDYAFEFFCQFVTALRDEVNYTNSYFVSLFQKLASKYAAYPRLVALALEKANELYETVRNEDEDLLDLYAQSSSMMQTPSVL